MVKINIGELMKILNDKNSLRILFYLREYNPNVSIEELNKELNISIEEIKDKLNELEEVGMIIHSNFLYSLSDEGRHILNRLYHELGENAPEEGV